MNRPLIAISLLLFVLTPLRAADTVTFAVGDWPPFTGQSLQHEGISTRVVREAFALVGIEVDTQFMPWKRAMTEAADQRADTTGPWRRSKERLEKFLYSQPILTDEAVIFHRVETPLQWSEFKDLSQYSIGATQGYLYDEAVNATVQQLLEIDQV